MNASNNHRLKAIRYTGLSLLSGMLLSLSWFPNGISQLLFFAFVPLLLLEEQLANTSRRPGLAVFGYSLLTFLTWNCLVTWWVYNASAEGAIMAIVANSLLMSITFTSWHVVNQKLQRSYNYLLFAAFWLSFEYLHHDWDLSWTWLTLGNAFADNYKSIQWYEYTGILGGSLWVLVCNCLILDFLRKRSQISSNKPLKTLIIQLTALLIIPISISQLRYYNYTPSSTGAIHVVVVQPNIDPYNVKFNTSFQLQLEAMLKLAAQKVDSSTDYLVFPETALVEDIWENELNEFYSIRRLRKFLQAYPKLKIITGASTFRKYQTGEKLSLTARKFLEEEGYYDVFNTALQVDSSSTIQRYHKSKLVPGSEKIPFPYLLKPLEKFSLDLGGTTGSLGTQSERSVFTTKTSPGKIAPVICYESIFGEFVTDYVDQGANAIFIITNDGWWGDTPGYKQHLAYGRLRAIETRREIARSANTGISCFINQRGDVMQPQGWWKEGVIQSTLLLNEENTIYVLLKDIIGKSAVLLMLIAFGYYVTLLLRRKKN